MHGSQLWECRWWFFVVPIWVSVMSLISLSYAFPDFHLSYESDKSQFCRDLILSVSVESFQGRVMRIRVIKLGQSSVSVFSPLWFMSNLFQKQRENSKKIVGILLNFGLTFDKRKQPATEARFNAAKFNLNDINDDDTCDWHLPWSVSLIVWKMRLRFHGNHRFNLEMNFKTQPRTNTGISTIWLGI